MSNGNISDFDGEEVTGVITISPAKTSERLKLSREYTMHEQIGEGGMGKVRLVTTTIFPEVIETLVIKIFDKEDPPAPDALERFHRESALLRKANHKHIVRFEDYFETDKFAYLVMEYVPGSDLEDHVIQNGPMDYITVITLHSQVLQALLYMFEENGTFHRDIKPGNIQKCDGEKIKAKLIDFGNAKIDVVDSEEMSLTMMSGNMTGTPGYTSPQVNYDNYAEQDDVFAIACSMIYCLFGKNPFEVNADFSASFRKIQEGLKKEELGRFEGTMLGQWIRINTSFHRKDRMTLSQALHSLERIMKDPSYAMRKVEKDFVQQISSDNAMMKMITPEERKNSQLDLDEVTPSHTLDFDPSMMTNPHIKLSIEELGEKIIETEEERRAEIVKEEQEAQALNALIDSSLKPAREEEEKKRKRFSRFVIVFLVLIIVSLLGLVFYLWNNQKQSVDNAEESSEKLVEKRKTSSLKKSLKKKKSIVKAKKNEINNLKVYKSIKSVYPHLKTKAKRQKLLEEAKKYYNYAKANNNQKAFQQVEWRWLAFLFKARVKNAKKLVVIRKLFKLYCHLGQKRQIKKMSRKYKKYGGKSELSCK